MAKLGNTLRFFSDLNMPLWDWEGAGFDYPPPGTVATLLPDLSGEVAAYNQYAKEHYNGQLRLFWYIKSLRHDTGWRRLQYQPRIKWVYKRWNRD